MPIAAGESINLCGQTACLVFTAFKQAIKWFDQVNKLKWGLRSVQALSALIHHSGSTLRMLSDRVPVANGSQSLGCPVAFHWRYSARVTLASHCKLEPPVWRGAWRNVLVANTSGNFLTLFQPNFWSSLQLPSRFFPAVGSPKNARSRARRLNYSGHTPTKNYEQLYNQ